MLEIVGHLVAGNAYFVRVMRVVANGAFAAGRRCYAKERESERHKNDGGKKKTAWKEIGHIHSVL
jgi:hypothetical protein